ncbi:MAG: EfeM/EfeO family lipoprotein [Microbacteriaceae bacterium]|nr:EfeM/EfeO family lipoprotein [Microbacteriaceae bacterium]
MLALVSAFVLVGAAGIVVRVAGNSARSAPQGSTIAIGGGALDCGVGWIHPHAGNLTFAVTNGGVNAEDVYLETADGSAVFGELEGIGVGATHLLSASLGQGSYHFVCLPSDADALIGPSISLARAGTPAHLTPGIRLVTKNDLTEPAIAYHAWITGQLPALSAGAAGLEAAVSTGDRAAAQAAWLTAHQEYESLGAAYGAFGDADAAINGTPAAGDTASNDPHLTGFHRIEGLLWSNAPVLDAAAPARQLVTDIASLTSQFASSPIDPIDVGLRAHEILENAIQFELTGATDAGSHTELATISANLDGTRQALEPLRDLLSTRYPGLAETDRWLARSTALVASFRAANGSWQPLTTLTPTQRSVLDATLDSTVELLAPVASICDPRRADK